MNTTSARMRGGSAGIGISSWGLLERRHVVANPSLQVQESWKRSSPYWKSPRPLLLLSWIISAVFCSIIDPFYPLIGRTRYFDIFEKSQCQTRDMKNLLSEKKVSYLGTFHPKGFGFKSFSGSTIVEFSIVNIPNIGRPLFLTLFFWEKYMRLVV